MLFKRDVYVLALSILERVNLKINFSLVPNEKCSD